MQISQALLKVNQLTYPTCIRPRLDNSMESTIGARHEIELVRLSSTKTWLNKQQIKQ